MLVYQLYELAQMLIHLLHHRIHMYDLSVSFQKTSYPSLTQDSNNLVHLIMQLIHMVNNVKT